MNVDKFGVDDICIKVYDPTNQQVIVTYDNYTEAARKLGLTYKLVYTGCTKKIRRFSPYLNKEVALRVASKNQSV